MLTMFMTVTRSKKHVYVIDEFYNVMIQSFYDYKYLLVCHLITATSNIHKICFICPVNKELLLVPYSNDGYRQINVSPSSFTVYCHQS